MFDLDRELQDLRDRRNAVQDLRKRRAARGMSDPLNVLRAVVTDAIENGAIVYVNLDD